MQADMDEILHMKLEGPLAKLLTRVDLKLHKKYTTTESGRPYMAPFKRQYCLGGSN
jgi:hypothetical protein